jgi:hypothetical protein
MPFFPASYNPGINYTGGESIARGLENLGGGIAGGWKQHEQDLKTDASNQYLFAQALEQDQIPPEALGLKSDALSPDPAQKRMQMLAAFNNKNRQAQSGIIAGTLANYVGSLKQEQAKYAETLASANVHNALAHVYSQGYGAGAGGVGAAQDIPGAPGYKTVQVPGVRGPSTRIIQTGPPPLPQGYRVDENGVLMIRSGPKGQTERPATMQETMAVQMSGATIPGFRGVGSGQPAQKQTTGEWLASFFKGNQSNQAGVPTPVRPPEEAQPGAQPGAQSAAPNEPPDSTPGNINGIPVIWRTGVGWIRAQ